MTAKTEVPRPKVILWFKVYAGFLCLLYLALAALALSLFLAGPGDWAARPPAARLVGTLLLVMGVSFFAACSLPLLLQPRPWLWTYNLVIICLGMTSMITLPASIALLIFWLKPEVKEFFGRT